MGSKNFLYEFRYEELSKSGFHIFVRQLMQGGNDEVNCAKPT